MTDTDKIVAATLAAAYSPSRPLSTEELWKVYQDFLGLIKDNPDNPKGVYP